MKFIGTGIWYFLNMVDDLCKAIVDFLEDVQHDLCESISNTFDSFIEFAIGVMFAILTLPIGVIGAFAHRLRKFCNREKLLRENWDVFYEWYKNKGGRQ